MIDVPFEVPRATSAGEVARETLTGLRADGTPAQTSLEAVDMRIIWYGSDGAILAEGLVSDGFPSLVLEEMRHP